MLWGLGAIEYSTEVLPRLIESGDRLFCGNRAYAKKWMFQQVNAPAHTAKMSKAHLEDRMKGRWVQDWPPSSPALSWIENVWAQADARLLCRRSRIRTVQEFMGLLKRLSKSFLVCTARIMLVECRKGSAWCMRRVGGQLESDGTLKGGWVRDLRCAEYSKI